MLLLLVMLLMLLVGSQTQSLIVWYTQETELLLLLLLLGLTSSYLPLSGAPSLLMVVASTRLNLSPTCMQQQHRVGICMCAAAISLLLNLIKAAVACRYAAEPVP
jgi:hypothetical protein